MVVTGGDERRAPMRAPARASAPSDARALVVRVDFGGCTLRAESGETFTAVARGALMGRRKQLGNAIVVGDVVELVREGERHVIVAVEPRRNQFSRRAAGERAVEQVVAANLDQVVLVASAANPEFKAGFVDRVLAQAEHGGLPARLVLNKADLGSRDEARAILADYARAGYGGLLVSAKSGEEIDHLRQVCRRRRSLFVGHSGVGKSTLLNALVPGLELVSGAVNAKTGKGRHTTTAAWLIESAGDLELIDTPGMRAFGLWGIGSADLDQSYPEFRPYLGECRFADCRHDREPGCAVLAAVAAGTVAARRMESYLKLRGELEAEAVERPAGRAR